MPTKYLVTFSGQRYHNTTKKIVEDGPKLGADKVLVFDDYWLWHKCPEHVAATARLRAHPGVRGVDWFSFKPRTLIAALELVNEGDLVLFTDADTYPISDLSPLYDLCQEHDVVLFKAQGWIQRQWCKRDCFLIMQQDEPKYWDATHGCARFMAYKKTQFNLDFLKEWLRYCCTFDCTTFDPSVLGQPELPGFRQHRCEQAILTNLAHKYNIPLHREACQFGNGAIDDGTDPDVYPQLFFQNGEYSYGDLSKPGSVFRNVPC